jgi:hypothetical protein
VYSKLSWEYFERYAILDEKEKVGVLVGRFEDADILEEEKSRIYLLPYWMI